MRVWLAHDRSPLDGLRQGRCMPRSTRHGAQAPGSKPVCQWDEWRSAEGKLGGIVCVPYRRCRYKRDWRGCHGWRQRSNGGCLEAIGCRGRANIWPSPKGFPALGCNGETTLGQWYLPWAQSVPRTDREADPDARDSHRGVWPMGVRARLEVSFDAPVACDPQSRCVRIVPRPPEFATVSGYEGLD